MLGKASLRLLSWGVWTIDKGMTKMPLRLKDVNLDSPSKANCGVTTRADNSQGGAMKLLQGSH